MMANLIVIVLLLILICNQSLSAINNDQENSLEYSKNNDTNDNINNVNYVNLNKIKSSLTKRVKKNLYSPIVIKNFNESNLTDNLRDELNKFGAYSKLISQLMNSIMNKELGVSFMQQKLDQTKTDTSMIHFSNLIDIIADKVFYFALFRFIFFHCSISNNNNR